MQTGHKEGRPAYLRVVIEHVSQRARAQPTHALPKPMRCDQRGETARKDTIHTVNTHADFAQPYGAARLTIQHPRFLRVQAFGSFTLDPQFQSTQLTQASGQGIRAKQPKFLMGTE